MVSLVAGKNAGEKRDTEETAEEKRLRKAQIKESKRVSQAPALLFALCPLAGLYTSPGWGIRAEVGASGGGGVDDAGGGD